MKLKEGQRVTVTAEGDGQTTMVVSERHRALNSYDLFMGQDGLVVDTSDTLARVQLDDQGIVVVVDRTTLWFALAETTKVWVAVIRHSELPEGEQERSPSTPPATARRRKSTAPLRRWPSSGPRAPYGPAMRNAPSSLNSQSPARTRSAVPSATGCTTRSPKRRCSHEPLRLRAQHRVRPARG